MEPSEAFQTILDNMPQYTPAPMRKDPPPIPEEWPEELARDPAPYIRFLITAPPGQAPRGNLGGGMYEASAEVAAWIHWINCGWW